MSPAAKYVSDLGVAVADQFGPSVTFSKVRKCLTWPTTYGDNFVALSGSNRCSPLISVDFYFGNRYDAATRVEKLLGRSKNEQRIGHIIQYSLNARLMEGLTFGSARTFEINIRNPPSNIASSVADAIRQIAFPFWNRYPTVRSARDALLSRDEWCFHAGGPFWHDLLYLDAALGEFEHYESWLAQLEPFYVPYASAEFSKVRDIQGAIVS
jgi:hypothetical protein